MKKCILMITMLFACLFCVSTVEAKTINLNESISVATYDMTSDYARQDDFSGNCADFAHTIRIGGYLLLVAKIIIPLAMIVKASLSLVSVVMNGKADEFNNQVKKFGTMMAAAIIIFLLPTIIDVTFGIVSKYNENITEDSRVCSACIFRPYSDDCTNYAD